MMAMITKQGRKALKIAKAAANEVAGVWYDEVVAARNALIETFPEVAETGSFCNNNMNTIWANWLNDGRSKKYVVRETIRQLADKVDGYYCENPAHFEDISIMSGMKEFYTPEGKMRAVRRGMFWSIYRLLENGAFVLCASIRGAANSSPRKLYEGYLKSLER